MKTMDKITTADNIKKRIDDFLDVVMREGINLNGVIMHQNGVTRAEYIKENIPRNIYSVTKSFLSCAVGILLDEELLSLSDRPIDFFPEHLPDSIAAGYEKLTLYHLLTMTSGHERPMLHEDERSTIKENDWIRFVLSQPLCSAPGERFMYSNGSAYLAGCMAEKVTGQKLKDFLYDRMLSRMDIPYPEWDECPLGHSFGGSRLYLTLSDMAKLGMLYLNKGRYEGRQILPRHWTETATSFKVASHQISAFGSGEDEKYGYGYYFWMCRYPGIYRAFGRRGQFVIVVPSKDTVIATSSDEDNEQRILDAVWKTLL